jgi:hypothetical protein
VGIIASLFTAILALRIVLVPIDDRPVTSQLPRLLGAIAGVEVVEPPRPLLGNYLTPGDPDAIARWLRDQAPPDARDYVVSSDMIAYGGLVASRIPGITVDRANQRLAALAALRERRSRASFAVFGTVMRLAPTGVPAVGDAASFPFAGPVWPQIQRYANLPDPPQTATQQAEAARLRGDLGPALDAYLATRARNLDVDLYALRLDVPGWFDRVVLGQDDAGPVGLHLRDLAALRSYAEQNVPPGRSAIEPGTDELAMALIASALAHDAGIVPRVHVVYSRAGGADVHDPLEFAPISTTIADLIRTCGAQQVDAAAPADVDLFVRVPQTSDADENAFVDAIARAPQRAAIADLSFLDAGNLAEQRRLTGELVARGVAGRVGAFASWNTPANTVGTALPEAIAVLAGQRLGTYDPAWHDAFTFMRYVDDVDFQKVVRPHVNADLSLLGVPDHTYLLPNDASFAASDTRLLLWPLATDLLAKLGPQFEASRFRVRLPFDDITLPWHRTFECELHVRLSVVNPGGV